MSESEEDKRGNRGRKTLRGGKKGRGEGGKKILGSETKDRKPE